VTPVVSIDPIPTDLLPALVVLVTALAIVAQHFLRGAQRGMREPSPRDHWIRQAIAGLVMAAMAMATALAARFDLVALLVPTSAIVDALPWMASAMVIVIAGSLVASRRPGFRAHYPEAPIDRWTREHWMANATAWASYLFGYELLFRGLCLGVLCQAWGTTSGVAVTTALYAVAHLPKNLNESLGSFPMGVVLAALTLAGGSVLPAFALHVVMALAADSFALWSPESRRASVDDGALGNAHASHPAPEGRRG